MPTSAAPDADRPLLAAVLVPVSLACMAGGASLSLPFPEGRRAASAYEARPLDGAASLARAHEGERVWLRGALDPVAADPHRPAVEAARGLVVYEAQTQRCRSTHRRRDDGAYEPVCDWASSRTHAGPVALRSGDARIALAWPRGWRMAGDPGWSAPEGSGSGARRARGVAPGGEVLVAGWKAGSGVRVEHVATSSPADYVAWRRAGGLRGWLAGVLLLAAGWVGMGWSVRGATRTRRRAPELSPGVVAMVQAPLVAAGMGMLAWSAVPLATLSASDLDAVLAIVGAAAVLAARRAARGAEPWWARVTAPPPAQRPLRPVAGGRPWATSAAGHRRRVADARPRQHG